MGLPITPTKRGNRVRLFNILHRSGVGERTLYNHLPKLVGIQVNLMSTVKPPRINSTGDFYLIIDWTQHPLKTDHFIYKDKKYNVNYYSFSSIFNMVGRVYIQANDLSETITADLSLDYLLSYQDSANPFYIPIFWSFPRYSVTAHYSNGQSILLHKENNEYFNTNINELKLSDDTRGNLYIYKSYNEIIQQGISKGYPIRQRKEIKIGLPSDWGNLQWLGRNA